MGEMSSIEDKNGNLEFIKENVTSLTDKVCRTCLSLVEPDCCTLIPTLDLEDKIGAMVTACLPQINLSLTKDPVVCQRCFAKLEDFYTFLLTCSNTENKLISYCTLHSLSIPINLTDIFKSNKSPPVESCNVKVEHCDDINHNNNDDDDNDEPECEIDTNSNDADVKSEDDDSLRDDKINIEGKTVAKRKKRVRRLSPKKSLDKKGLFSKDLAETSVKCELCNKKFPSKWALDRHTPVHTEERKFVCETCNMTFRYKHSFQKHLLAHLNGTPVAKPFACECGKFFNRKAKLIRHQEIHVKKDKPFGCEICGKRFLDQESLNGHVLRVHNSEKAFSCELCGNKYSSKSGLDVHFKIHFPSDKPKPEPDLMCDFCGKLFYRKYSLEKHRMSHTGDKPHECEVCGMRFKERYQLTIHNRRHTGEKPFDCTICGFKFPSKNRLGVHMRIHTGVRPFPCQMCEMAFTRKDHLIKHVRAIHTGERPFECDVCLKTFNRRDYLIKHKRVHIKKGL